MNNKFFDKWEFDRALDIADLNPLESKLRFEEYLRKYPKDYSAYTYYIYVLIILGKFDEAERVLNFINTEYKKDSQFNIDSSRVKLLKKNILFSTMKLLSYQEKFEELELLFSKYRKELNDINLNTINFYCKKKNGKLNPNKREINSYIFRQIVEYKESDFFEHIKKHLDEYNINLENKNDNVFVPDFPINDIVLEIKKYIPSNKGLHFGFFEDIYVFKYNECGRENNKLVDYLKVVCFHNTKDFITILPAAHCEQLPYVDINYLINDKKEVKIKRLSQTEKFNQKYRNN